MKTQLMKSYRIYLFGISTLFMLSFIPAKYSSDFKKEKKKIDMLTILSPIVHVVANNNSTQYLDSTLTKANQELLDSLTNKMLIEKYYIKNITLPELDINIFTDLFKQLESSPKLLDNISTKALLSELNLEYECKYALMLVYNGQINPDFPPHYNIKSGLASNSIVINSSTKPYSKMRLMIIDTEIESVVFYDMVNSSNFDPRVSAEVEQMAKKIMKKIYYK
jgi:hypothetical protein